MQQLGGSETVSVEALAAMGVGMAYVKPVEHEGRIVWAIHAGDGRPLALAATRELALATARQNDLEVTCVH